MKNNKIQSVLKEMTVFSDWLPWDFFLESVNFSVLNLCEKI